MSQSTTIHLVSTSDPLWEPDRAFLERLFEHVGASRVKGMFGYDQARLCDDEESNDEEVYRQDLSLTEALDASAAEGLVGWWYGLECKEWGKRLYEELLSLPEEVRGDYAPWDVNINVGLFSLPTWDQEETAGTFRFSVELWGYRIPTHPDRYVRLSRENSPSLRALLAFLEGSSGQTFGLVLEASF